MDPQEPSTSAEMSEESFNNTPEEIRQRRKLRKKYRDNITDLLQNKEQYIQEDGKLLEKMEEQKKLYAHVRNPREAVCDAELLRCVAQVGRERAQHIPINLVQFNPGTYAEKLAILMRGDRLALGDNDEPVLREEWAFLGKKCLQYFKRVPTFHYMFGSFDRGEVVLKQRAARVIKKDKDIPATATAPKELSGLSRKEAQESTTEEIERVLGRLHKIYESNNREAFCLFEFVLNPNSFSLTIENIFHVSFLVRDKAAQIYLDEDGLPVIEPIPKGKESSSKPSKTKQMIIDMTIDKWKELVETFKIKKPLIPPRT